MHSSPAGRAAQVRTFHHSRYAPAQLAAARAQRGLRVSVCLPARECAATVGRDRRRAAAAARARRASTRSSSSTPRSQRRHRARPPQRAGAVVLQEAELMPERGPVLGKGDAMWRALPALSGELVCFLDADTEGFPAHFATGLLGPLLCERGVSFVQGASTAARCAAGDAPLPDGGGRVNHLTARPALALFYPQLAAIRQPLAGEVAARRELLWRLPFATGYGVEIAMLIDAWREVGLDGDRAGRPRRAPQPQPAAVRRSRRWRSPCSPRSPPGCARKGACSDRGPGGRRSSTPSSSARRTRPASTRARREPLRGVTGDGAPRRAACTSTSTARCSGAARRCCTTARGGCRSRACAPCRRACARTSRWC